MPSEAEKEAILEALDRIDARLAPFLTKHDDIVAQTEDYLLLRDFIASLLSDE